MYFLRTKSASRLRELIEKEKTIRLFRAITIQDVHEQVIKHQARLAGLDINSFAQDEQEIREAIRK